MKYKTVTVIAIVLIAGLLFYYFNDDSKVCLENKCFNVEVASTDSDRMKGLMYRETLAQNDGMLFIFDNVGNYPFWMKNTLIPLDMIWINSDYEIIFVKKNAQPCKVEPCEIINHEGVAKYVLEVNSGITDKFNINVGQKVKFDL